MTRLACLALALATFAACDGDGDAKDTPAVAAAKAECRRLEGHMFQISPQSKDEVAGKSADELLAIVAARVPVEDIEQCAAGNAEVRACILGAADVDAVRACIPPAEVIACMERAKLAPEIKSQCAKDPHAADKLPAPTE